MKYIMILIMCMQVLVLLNGVTGEFDSGSIVIEFPNNINPKIQDGVVITGNATVDSLNAVIGAINFEYYDLSWTSRLKHILVLYFDATRVIDVEDEVLSYSQATSGLSARVEFIPNPEIESIPGEFLYSENIYHPEDTLWKLYDDADDKRNWAINARFQYQNSAGSWIPNDIVYDLYDDYWGPMNPEVVDELLKPFPYHWAYHAHSSLWQHLDEYNNTYRAWDFTEGEQTLAICLDPHGFWTQHPDLIDRWLPGYPQFSNDGQIPYAGTTPSNYMNWYKYKYHGTSCAGAMAASKQPMAESELTNLSSVGVAPQTNLIGMEANVFTCLDYLHIYSELQPIVLNASYTISFTPTQLDAFEELIDMGVTIVKSRGYGDNPSQSCMYGNLLEGFINIGDYRPDYRVKTKHNVDSYNSDERYYKAEINAPGWDIWIPNVYHTYESGFTQVGYALAMGTNTSIAAPQVGGVVCLIKSLYPWMTPAEVERQIKLGAHHLEDLITANEVYLPTTPPSFFGAGCLNAFSSLYLHGDFDRSFVFENEANNTALIGKEFELISSSMTVNNGTLRIEKNADVLFTNSTLALADNVTVVFEGYSKITLDSNSYINIGNNVTFTNENGDLCYGIFINGENQISLSNCTFTNCDLNIEYGSLTAVNSSFVNSAINCNRTIVSITDCPTLGGVYCNGSELVEIINNTENAYNISGMYDGVTLINCGVTNIYNYTITGNARNGINLHESYGSNTIENCSIISNCLDGVRLYHSSARIIGCQISGNQKGVIAYRGSNVEILKDPNSAPWFHDSCITNNTWMEVLFTDDCDLQMAHGMNKILDAPYNPDTFDKYLVFCPNMTRSRDLGVNYWGSDLQGMPIYPAEERFEPSCINPDANEIGFNLNPLWNPGPPSIITWENDELIYHNAIDLALAEDITGAVALFKDLISQYPGSDFAPAAAKNLLALEEDKQALKDYYATEPNLHWNGEIDKLADYLENYCNIKLGDYQAAISWFEDIISDPDCELDSLMTVIDLGYVYLLMQENSPKAQITCQFPQLVPKSRTQYEQKTNAILSALYSPVNGTDQEDDANTIPILPQIPVLHSNYPNPFNPSTSISFSLPADMHCSLYVYNIKGQKVKTLHNGVSTQGNHTLIWNGSDDNGISVSSGIYFYQFNAQGKTITKKMIMVK